MSDIISLVNLRRTVFGEEAGCRLTGSLQTHSTLIDRLGYSHQLEGHKGCVNCLQWNDNGSLLASGSDDLYVNIWNAYEKKLVASMNSGHTGNIFSVKFLPFTGDMGVVSGAEDMEVRLHDLTTFTTTKIWSCSTGRIKRLAVSNQSPFVVWSASEDGCIRQHDVREHHTCPPDRKCRNVLVDLRRTNGPSLNCKCIDVNPVRHEQIAVGAYDPFVRLYDTRILSLSYPSTGPCDRPDAGCIAHLAPGHISQSFRNITSDLSGNVACTYVCFSPNGNELLANLSSEQVYLFNITSLQPVLTYSLQGSEPLLVHKPSYCPAPPIECPGDLSVTDRVRAFRDTGNQLFKASRYTAAIEQYSSAILLDPSWHLLYSNRAAALVKRNWSGDMYSALLDTERALSLCPSHHKSLRRRISCLKCLCWVKEALWYLKKYALLFPNEEEYCVNIDTELKKLKAESSKNGFHGNNKSLVSLWEQSRQQNASDYCQRFIGHCNTHTDIKEATFLGQNGEYIGAGSDDGNAFIWDKRSGNLVKVLIADESIVNCVQWNPTGCILATSGIEPVVKIWEPRPPIVSSNIAKTIDNVHKVSESNQRRMRLDPFEIMLLRLGLRVNQDEQPEAVDSNYQAQCRQS